MQKCGIRCADRAPSKIEYNNHPKSKNPKRGKVLKPEKTI